jgi:hypothetical protein
MKECGEYRSDYQELSGLVTRELPQAQGTLRQKLAEMSAKPLPYSRQRFLRRARAEGVVFSREVETPVRWSRWYFRPVVVLAQLRRWSLLRSVLRFTTTTSRRAQRKQRMPPRHSRLPSLNARTPRLQRACRG